jgi:hypothetical protein
VRSPVSVGDAEALRHGAVDDEVVAEQHLGAAVGRLEDAHLAELGEPVDEQVALVAQVGRLVARHLGRDDLPVELRDLLGPPVELRDRVGEAERRLLAHVAEPLIEAVERRRHGLGALHDDSARRAARRLRGELRPRRPERVHAGGEPRLGRLAEHALDAPEQVAPRRARRRAAGLGAPRGVEQQVARAAHVVDAHARAHAAVGQAQRVGGAQLDALAREAGRLDVGDVVPRRLQDRLLNGERLAGDAEDGAERHGGGVGPGRREAASGRAVEEERAGGAGARAARLGAGGGDGRVARPGVGLGERGGGRAGRGAGEHARVRLAVGERVAQHAAVHVHLGGERGGRVGQLVARDAQRVGHLRPHVPLERGERQVVGTAEQAVDLLAAQPRLAEGGEQAVRGEDGVVDRRQVVGGDGGALAAHRPGEVVDQLAL